MLPFRAASVVKVVLLLLFIGSATEFVLTTDAEARAGRGRSSGRGGGFGPKRSAPPPQQQPAPTTPAGQPGGSPGGSLMRGMAGGLAGGFLGSMLFSSMGQAKNADGSPAGGGVGFLEIILFGGLAYFGFRWWKNRQATAAFSHASVRHGGGYQTLQREAAAAIEPSQLGHVRALADSGAVLTTDEASDLFFKVQGAWTRRDLSPIKAVLGPEMHDSLSDDLGALKARHHINRLENIAVRSTEVLNAWQEAGADYTSVRFSANLLDYTVDETTGKVVDGDDVTPVKFQEDWTFAKATPSAPWQLVGIAQV